jgi:hypothetical protein
MNVALAATACKVKHLVKLFPTRTIFKKLKVICIFAILRIVSLLLFKTYQWNTTAHVFEKQTSASKCSDLSYSPLIILSRLNR